jgi:rhodanese-related sulfurtransferase
MMRKSAYLVLGLALVLGTLAAPAWATEPQDSIHTFLSALPADFETVANKTVQAKLDASENIFVLDVREADEFKAGHIDGAVNVPIRTLAQNLDKLPKDKKAAVAVVCKSGIRAAYGTMALKQMGYSNVKDIAGGMLAWEKDGLPLTK